MPHPPLEEPPEWASDQHVFYGVEYICAHCYKHEDRTVELEIDSTKRIATWMGVNWEDGFVEKLECPECGYTGQVKTKLMNEYREDTKFVRTGVAAPPTPEDPKPEPTH